MQQPMEITKVNNMGMLDNRKERKESFEVDTENMIKEVKKSINENKKGTIDFVIDRNPQMNGCILPTLNIGPNSINKEKSKQQEK